MPILRATTVESIMIKPAFVDINDNIVQVAKMLLQTKKGCVFVTNHDKAVGIITDRDFQRYIVKEAGMISSTSTAKEFMISPVITIRKNASVEEADQLMHKEKIQRLGVIEKANPNIIIGLLDYNATHAELITKFAKSLINREQYFKRE
ncbi:MAG TPA: CBS domain-containing protein [Candidatus Bathyarchaeia archaeon]|nr:CBS domain-containing protein [Candidatus Bathyarchaeia archaeon]